MEQNITITIDSSTSTMGDVVEKMQKMCDRRELEAQRQVNGYIYNLRIKKGDEVSNIDVAVGVKHVCKQDADEIFFSLEDVDMLYDFISEPCMDFIVLNINNARTYTNIVPINEDTDLTGIKEVYRECDDNGMVAKFEVVADHGKIVTLYDIDGDCTLNADKWSLFVEDVY